MIEPKPPVAILAGGRGTRLREQTVEIPKALVEIGGRPILWHVIRIYAAQGFERFLVLTGHKGEMIEEWAATEDWGAGVSVEALPTGEETPTGGRIRLAADRLEGGTFCATYADGVADIDLGALLDFHRASDLEGTVTVVQPELQFGVTRLKGDGVEGFEEKPTLDMWINGGFFCFEPAFLDRLRDDSVLERDPLESLAAEKQLGAFRHEGFWDCMDTYKDAVTLNDLWERGEAPWQQVVHS